MVNEKNIFYKKIFFNFLKIVMRISKIKEKKTMFLYVYNKWNKILPIRNLLLC